MAQLIGGHPSAIPRVVSVLSSSLQRVAEHNDHATHRPPAPHHRDSAFYGPRKPTISVRRYLERIFRFVDCSPACYVVAYIYLDRFTQRHPPVIIDSFNVHRLLISSILIAVKFLDDIHYDNAYFANVGGISLREMNHLEMDFLFGVSFELNVTPMTFGSYCSLLRREMYLLESPPPPVRFHRFLTDESSNSQ